MVQKYAVWFGGSLLGSNPNFHRICHSKAQYEEIGPSICRHNAVFGTWACEDSIKYNIFKLKRYNTYHSKISIRITL